MTAVPTVTLADGTVILSPAEAYLPVLSNVENPELYAIFPYRLYQVTKDNLTVAINSFNRRKFPCNVGWCQDVQQAVLLGLTEEASRMIVQRFTEPTQGMRFPAFWGPYFDYVPEEDHGATGKIALQWMIAQPGDENKILMFPSWPKEWDVEFKLFLPLQTTVEGTCLKGNLVRFIVIPPHRISDVQFVQDYCKL